MSKNNWQMKSKEPFVTKDNKIVIPYNKNHSFSQQIETLMLGKQKNTIDNNTQGLFNSFLSIGKLEKDGRGTQVPFISTFNGKFAINPSSVSISTFQKMIEKDDIVRRCYETNVSTIVASIGDYYNSDPKVQELVRYAGTCLKGGIPGLFTSMCSYLWAGSWVGTFKDERDDEGRTIIRYMSHLPAISVQYTLDEFGMKDGTYQYVYSAPFGNIQNSLSNMYGLNGNQLAAGGGDSSYAVDAMSSLGNMDFPMRTNFINQFGLMELNPEYTFHIAYDRHNGGINPSGYSLLSTMHPIWLQKTMTQILYTSAMQRCANPMLIGYADAQKVVATSDNEMSINAVQLLYNALQYYTEESAIILPGAKGDMFDVQVVDYTGDFSVYEKALSYQNKCLENAFFVPSGLFDGSSSYAGATAQNSLYAKMMKSIADELQLHCLNNFVKYIIQENFGDDIKDFGRFEDRLQNLDDQLKLSKVVETLTAQGYLSADYKPHTDVVLKLMGLPEMSEEEFDKFRKIVNEQLKINNEQQSSVKDTSNKTETKQANSHYKNNSVTEIN